MTHQEKLDLLVWVLKPHYPEANWYKIAGWILKTWKRWKFEYLLSTINLIPKDVWNQWEEKKDIVNGIYPFLTLQINMRILEVWSAEEKKRELKREPKDVKREIIDRAIKEIQKQYKYWQNQPYGPENEVRIREIKKRCKRLKIELQ